MVHFRIILFFFLSRKRISWFRYTEQALRCSVGLSGDVADQSCWFCVWWPISQHAGIILSSSNNRETSEVFTDPAAWGLIFFFCLIAQWSWATSRRIDCTDMCICVLVQYMDMCVVWINATCPWCHGKLHLLCKTPVCDRDCLLVLLTRLTAVSWTVHVLCSALVFFYPDVSLEIMYFIFRCL